MLKKKHKNWVCDKQLFVLPCGALQLFSTNFMYMSIYFTSFENCNFRVAAWGDPYTLFETVTIACFSIGAPSERSRLRATFDFVPFDGDPPERRGCVASPPLCGPPRRQG